MLDDFFLFVLPNGRSAQVDPPSARLICDRLWDLGVMPGAATAAAKISDALHSAPVLRDDVAFTNREVAPLLEASMHHAPTWASLVDDPEGDVGLAPEQRQVLLATCDAVIDRLTTGGDEPKLRALLADLQRLAARLRPSTD